MKPSIALVGVIMLVMLSATSTAWEPTKTAKSVEEVVAQLKEDGVKVEQTAEKDRTVEALSGHYSHGPGLSGYELHLFSDSTYILTQWADILPETIFAKGTWSVKNGFVVLKSDGSISYPSLLQDNILASLSWKELNNDGAILLGNHWFFSYYLDHKSSGPKSMLRICSIHRVNKPSKEEEGKIRKELMKKAWRPEFFKDDDDDKERQDKEKKSEH